MTPLASIKAAADQDLGRGHASRQSFVRIAVPMAGDQIRKRRVQNDISQNDHAAKKRKTTSTRIVAPKFPSAFYDELSEIPLTLNILLELDQRNDARAKTEKRASVVGSLPKDISRFARRGGADLQHLRQFSSKVRNHSIMENTRSSSGSRRTQSTRATSVTSRSGSSRYGKEFDQHLRDHGVYMNNRKSKPLNTEETRLRLEQSRASLSPSQFSEQQFEAFQRTNEDVVFESDVMADVIPIICGGSRIPSKQNVLFTELEPLTNGNAVRPKPDQFDGADLADLCMEVRNDDKIRQRVIPTKHRSVPVAANFFIEAKGPDGNASVAQRQACYDGAYGARAMHTLQNYGKNQPEYDGNAYTYSSTYHPATGTLQLYAHHITAPVDAGGRAEYHMTKLCGFDLTNNRASFVEGATLFRNARQLAKEHRNRAIHAANEKAAGLKYRNENKNRASASWQDAHDALQEGIAETCENNSKRDAEANDLSLDLHADDDSNEPSQVSTVLGYNDPSVSFTSSFTSTLSNQPVTRSKRTRQVSSPDSSWGRSSSKSRTRDGLNLITENPAHTAQPEPFGCKKELEQEEEEGWLGQQKGNA